jgi:hypothetical protein
MMILSVSLLAAELINFIDSIVNPYDLNVNVLVTGFGAGEGVPS